MAATPTHRKWGPKGAAGRVVWPIWGARTRGIESKEPDTLLHWLLFCFFVFPFFLLCLFSFSSSSCYRFAPAEARSFPLWPGCVDVWCRRLIRPHSLPSSSQAGWSVSRVSSTRARAIEPVGSAGLEETIWAAAPHGQLDGLPATRGQTTPHMHWDTHTHNTYPPFGRLLLSRCWRASCWPGVRTCGGAAVALGPQRP